MVCLVWGSMYLHMSREGLDLVLPSVFTAEIRSYDREVSWLFPVPGVYTESFIFNLATSLDSA
jgi:hypothetical protein